MILFGFSSYIFYYFFYVYFADSSALYLVARLKAAEALAIIICVLYIEDLCQFLWRFFISNFAVFKSVIFILHLIQYLNYFFYIVFRQRFVLVKQHMQWVYKLSNVLLFIGTGLARFQSKGMGKFITRAVCPKNYFAGFIGLLREKLAGNGHFHA